MRKIVSSSGIAGADPDPERPKRTERKLEMKWIKGMNTSGWFLFVPKDGPTSHDVFNVRQLAPANWKVTKNDEELKDKNGRRKRWFDDRAAMRAVERMLKVEENGGKK